MRSVLFICMFFLRSSFPQVFILATFSRIFAFCFHTGPNHRVIYAVIFNSLLKWVAFCPSAPEQSKYTSGMPAAVSQYVCVCLYLGSHLFQTFTAHKYCPECVPVSTLFSFFFFFVCIRCDCCGLGTAGYPTMHFNSAAASMAGSVYSRSLQVGEKRRHSSERTWQYTY